MPLFKPDVKTASQFTNLAVFGDKLWARMSFVATVFLILLSVGLYFYDRHLMQTSIRVPATVVALPKNMDGQTVPEVEYVVQEKTYRIYGTPTTPSPFTMGQKVGVYFDPATPQYGRLDVGHERFFLIGLCLLMAPVFALWGRYFNKRHKQSLEPAASQAESKP